MNKLEIYKRLPYPLKSLSASAWGYYLRWLRYGPETEKLVEETLKRDTWSKEQWQTWQEERLAYILGQAATRVPYYREQWQTRRKNGDRSSWELLENWPKLDKAVVRESPRQFISDEVTGRHLYLDHTGGTTGKPTLIYMSTKVVRQYFAIYETRIRRWNGLNYKDRWGIFGGQKIIPLEQRNPPYWIWNKGLNQVYFSIFHINEETSKDYVNALWHYSPTNLVVYPSAFSVLARIILRNRLKVPEIKAIISNSENLTSSYRESIQDAFNCAVVDTYGMAEMLSAASECSEGNMHFWPECGYMEIYDPKGDQFTTESIPGLYCMTSLINEDMPLIRYLNGDVGSLPKWEKACSCGRSLSILGPVQGRSNDLIISRDGRELYILDSLFNGLPVVESQIIQTEINRFEIKTIPGEGYTRQDVDKEIHSRLTQYLGEVEIQLNEVAEIERDRNGKFKPFISHIKRHDDLLKER